MSDKCHGAATPAEFRISTCSPSSMYNLSPQERGGLGLRCHDSICWMLPPQIGTCKAQGMKLDKRSDDWLTVLHMAQGQCFAYCGVSWKFVVFPCLRNFHGATTAAAWINCPGITFQPCRNHLIFNRIQQFNWSQTITFWGAKSKFVAASEER